jgi:hypothetical protein
MNGGRKQRHPGWLTGLDSVSRGNVCRNAEGQCRVRASVDEEGNLRCIAKGHYLGDFPYQGIFVLASRRPISSMQNNSARRNDPGYGRTRGECGLMARFQQLVAPTNDRVPFLWSMLDHFSIKHVPKIDQVGDFGTYRSRPDLRRRSFLERTAVVHDHNPIR